MRGSRSTRFVHIFMKIFTKLIKKFWWEWYYTFISTQRTILDFFKKMPNIYRQIGQKYATFFATGNCERSHAEGKGSFPVQDPEHNNEPNRTAGAAPKDSYASSACCDSSGAFCRQRNETPKHGLRLPCPWRALGACPATHTFRIANTADCKSNCLPPARANIDTNACTTHLTCAKPHLCGTYLSMTIFYAKKTQRWTIS